MAHHRQLVAFRQRSLLGTTQLLGNFVIAEIVPWQTVTSATFLREFEDQVSI